MLRGNCGCVLSAKALPRGRHLYLRDFLLAYVYYFEEAILYLRIFPFASGRGGDIKASPLTSSNAGKLFASAANYRADRIVDVRPFGAAIRPPPLVLHSNVRAIVSPAEYATNPHESPR